MQYYLDPIFIVKIYISLEKRKQLRHLCNRVNYLHKICQDNAERVSEVHGLLKISISKIQNGGQPPS